MARTIYMIGNDGAGKTTYGRRFESRARSLGLRVIRKHYYSSVVRHMLRGGVEKFAAVRGAKRATHTDQVPQGGDRRRRKARKHAIIIVFLWVYQTGMGIELLLRSCFSGRGVLIMDRSYVDDLVSISEAMRIEIPHGLLRWSAWLFPTHRIFFLSAGSEVEFSRIVGVDLSPEFHRRKGTLYSKLVRRLQDTGVRVRYVNTAGRQALTYTKG